MELTSTTNEDSKPNRLKSKTRHRLITAIVILAVVTIVAVISCVLIFVIEIHKSDTTGPEKATVIPKLTSLLWSTAPVPVTREEIPLKVRSGPNWSTWAAWSSCDVTCGGGLQARSRDCFSSDGSSTGDCPGKSSQVRSCSEWNCPDCAKTCVEGVLDKTCLFCLCEGDIVAGTVTDIAGAPLKDVNIYRAENPLAEIATTDSGGNYDILDVCVNGAGLIFGKDKFVSVSKTTSSSRRRRQGLGRQLSLQVTMARLEPLVMSEHPQNKVRYHGQTVSLCCMAKGNPSPSYYEWFKDEVILDDTIYDYNNTLILSDLKYEDGGRYKCRANGDGGSQYSQTALLTVIESDESICNTLPQKKLLKLPDDCETTNGSNYYNVGKCPHNLCPNINPNQQCVDSQSYCCGPITTETFNISCRAFSLPLQVISACGCVPCGRQTIKVRGIAIAADDGTPLNYGYVLVENEQVDRTNSKGRFSFELPKGKGRVSVTFKSRKTNDFVTTTKIFTLSEETSTYHTVYLQRRAPSVTLNGSVDATIPLGGDEGQANAELFIPAGSFYKEDGTPYTGNVQASLTPTNLTDQSAVDTIQSDLSTRDAEGQQMPLKTFGMFSMQFTDDNDDPLRVDGDMKLFIDAEKANIDTSAASLPHLWFLNEQTGEWEDIGGLEISQERRKKRQFDTQDFVVGNVNLIGYDLTNLPMCNIDQIESGPRVCHLKVRAYTDDSLTEPLEGVTVTAITNDLVVRDRYAPDLQSGRFSFFYTATTGPDGSACVLTFCGRDDSLFSVNLKAQYGNDILMAIHPNDVPHDKHPGQWPQDLLQTLTLPQSAGDETGWVTMRGLTPQMAYTLTEYAEKFWYGWDWWNWYSDDYEWNGWEYEWYDYERIESRELGPFYWQWWNYYTAKEKCIDANLTENHLVFVHPTQEGGLYEYEHEDYDIESVDDQERDRTVYSWFPYENENKRVCFIKILVEGATSERFSVSSFSGGHPRVADNTMYGLRIDDSKPDPPVSGISPKTAACIEFKCSGYLREGDAFGEDRLPDADETIIKIAPSFLSWSRCQLKGNLSGSIYQEAANSNLVDFITDNSLLHMVTFDEDLKTLRFQIPHVDIPDYMAGIYVSKGDGRNGYDDALKNCHAGRDTAYLDKDPAPDPDSAWAVTYVCE